MKFAFIIDSLPRLDPGHDSTVAIMEAAQTAGHEVWITQVHELSVIEGKAWAILSKVELTPVELQAQKWVAAPNWYQISETVLRCLENMNAVFMRKDPPVTLRYLYATYILELINSEKTLVINSPQGLREANEKMYTLQFYPVMPETIISSDKTIIHKFVEEKKLAILKPLGGKAGEGILLLDLNDCNFNSLIEVSTFYGQEAVMVQRFIPEAKDGDKRIILLDGQPIGAVNRIPTGKEFRGNMAVGGKSEKTEITSRELEICEILGTKLRKNGLYFVGIDIIGGYLTEVNVTSPTGIREIDRLDNTNLGEKVINWLETK